MMGGVVPMGGFAGADVAELRDLAALFASRASALRTLETQLTGRINGSRWDGADAARFVGDWNTGHRKAIAGAVVLFDRVAQDLRSNRPAGPGERRGRRQRRRRSRRDRTSRAPAG